MTELKKSPEELEAELLKFHALREKRKQEGLKAVEEMSKHPLSLEQAREQIRQHLAEARSAKIHCQHKIISLKFRFRLSS